ncbi:MAG: hypothetical protein ACYC6L_01745 [Anaerolineae bacterium]
MRPFIAFILVLGLLLAGCSAGPKAPELTVETYPLAVELTLETDQVTFASSVQGDPRTLYPELRAQTFPDTSCMVDNNPGFCTTLGKDEIAASESYNNAGYATLLVTSAGIPVKVQRVGKAGPINMLRGLWTWDKHWAAEIADTTRDIPSNLGMTGAYGDIFLDGNTLNGKYGYTECFGLQTIAGQPFYFFLDTLGRVSYNYAGKVVSLELDEVAHNTCCSAAAYNPVAYQDMVAFYGRNGSTWQYVIIRVAK